MSGIMLNVVGGTFGGIPAIGAAFGGGFFAGQISTAGNSIADYNLVVGPDSTAQGSYQWKTARTATSGTSSVIDGPANSTSMNNASHPAAQFCKALTVGGFTDWYMPAKNELEVCYYNLKYDTTANNTSSGINANAVPARASNYTSGDPTQTTATAFKIGNAETFGASSYWSSTECSVLVSPFFAAYAYNQRFLNGRQYSTYPYKTSSKPTRAVRRVAV